MGQVEVQFLGSGDALGSGGRLQTCFLIRGNRQSLLLDCGTSSLIAMKRWGVDPSEISLILISHLHGDHFGGIPFFVLEGQFSRRTMPLRITGPEGIEARMREAMEVLFPGSSKIEGKFPLEFTEFHDRQETILGAVAVIPHAVNHPSGGTAYALRLNLEGKVIGYSGDTEWTETLIEVAKGADLFICEAYFFEKKIKYHLDYKTLLAHRYKLGCRRLILTHMSEDMLGRREESEMEWAEDGKKIRL